MSINKKSNCEITIDDDNLKNLGFSKASIIDKNIFIKFGDGRSPILSKFKGEDLVGTLKGLEKKLIDKGISVEAVKQLSTFLAEKLIRKVEEIEAQKEAESSSTNTDIQKILEEIAKDKSAIGQISAEEWRSGVLEKYQNLQKTVEKNLPNIWPALEFALSIKTILNIQDCTLPFAGILLGPPSSLKTVCIELFRKWPQTYYTDNFSAKSFVSHSTAVTKEELAEIDTLPKIKNKLFLTPELAPTFAAKEDDLIQVLGIMTRILDGHGYESDTGAHGHRGYCEEMMFTWIGAAVDIPHKVHKYLSTLGPKLYFLRLPRLTKSEDDYYNQLDDDFVGRKKEVQTALFEYLKYFEIGPETIMVAENGLPKVSWNGTKDEELAKIYIVRLGELLAHLRGVVPALHTQDTQGSNYGYGMAIIEEPDRAITQLRNLARGGALSKGRNYITVDDIPMVIKVVMSTASIERVTIFDLLLAHRGKMTTSQIAASLNISNHTAHRTMTELKALGLVEMEKESDGHAAVAHNSEFRITLDSMFIWFLDEEFLQLREGFFPLDNSKSLKKQTTTIISTAEKEHEEKDPLSVQKNDSTVVKESEEARTREELEEKIHLTNDSNQSASNYEVLEEKNTLSSSSSCESNKHEEKTSLTTTENFNTKIPQNNPKDDDDNTNSQSKEEMEKSIVEGDYFSSGYDYDSESIFFKVFDELLSKADSGNGYDCGDRQLVVDYEKLRLGLISTGKFFAGDAVLIIRCIA